MLATAIPGTETETEADSGTETEIRTGRESEMFGNFFGVSGITTCGSGGRAMRVIQMIRHAVRVTTC